MEENSSLPSWFHEAINQIIGFGEHSEKTKNAIHEAVGELLESEIAKVDAIIRAERLETETELRRYFDNKITEAKEFVRSQKDAEKDKVVQGIFENIESYGGLIGGGAYEHVKSHYLKGTKLVPFV